MKKCRQCGMLSADTAVVCRHCNVKFTEDDKPIVAKQAKKNKGILTVLTVVVAVFAIATFVLHQTGMLKTWSQSAEKSEIKIIAEEFVKADFAKDTQKIKSYMFDQYISLHESQGTFSLENNRYISFYFSLYNPNSSIEILSVTSEFLEDDFELYSREIVNKYSVTPSKIVSVKVEVQITDEEFARTVIAPMTFIEFDKNWFILPVL